MNRDIKFRGRKIGTGEWVYGVPIKNSFGKRTFICTATVEIHAYPIEKLHSFCFEVASETITQYTGKKDIDDVEIYEHDITVTEDKQGVWLVRSFDGGFAINFLPMFGFDTKNHKVIGNIYETPELVDWQVI